MKKQHIFLATVTILIVQTGCYYKEKTDTVPNQKENIIMDRYQTGLKNLNRIDGRAGEEVVENLSKTSPDLARYVVEYPFGDIYNRPGLSLRDREIATIASLVTQGALPQLEVHIRAGLHVGLTKKEIEEIIIQMSVYSGFPSSLNAMGVAGKVFLDY